MKKEINYLRFCDVYFNNLNILKMKNKSASLETVDFEKANDHFSIKSSTQHPGSNFDSRKSSTDNLFKVVLLGDSKVGKSSIVMRLVVRFKKN